MKQRTFHSAAFTLVEVLLASAILAVILLGMQSAMLLAARAAPDRSGGLSASLNASRAVDQLSADLAFASTIVSMTDKLVEFTVPDRTGDNSPETIRYSWSGTAGAPLQRTFNGGSAVNVADNIHEFSLTYNRRTQQRSPTYTESGEVLFSSNDGLGLLNLGDGAIDSDNFYAQYFNPTLPASAVSWRLTRVKFKARTHGPSGGTTLIQARTAISSKPAIVLEEASMLESSLSSSYTWQEVAFSNVSGLVPGTGLCVVFQWVNDAHSCDVQYQSLLATAANADLVTTSNSGSSWTVRSGQDMIHYIYGTYSTADPVAYDYWLSGVACTIRSGTDLTKRVRSTIRVLNEPQVGAP